MVFRRDDHTGGFLIRHDIGEAQLRTVVDEVVGIVQLKSGNILVLGFANSCG